MPNILCPLAAVFLLATACLAQLPWQPGGALNPTQTPTKKPSLFEENKMTILIAAGVGGLMLIIIVIIVVYMIVSSRNESRRERESSGPRRKSSVRAKHPPKLAASAASPNSPVSILTRESTRKKKSEIDSLMLEDTIQSSKSSVTSKIKNNYYEQGPAPSVTTKDTLKKMKSTGF